MTSLRPPKSLIERPVIPPAPNLSSEIYAYALRLENENDHLRRVNESLRRQIAEIEAVCRRVPE